MIMSPIDGRLFVEYIVYLAVAYFAVVLLIEKIRRRS